MFGSIRKIKESLRDKLSSLNSPKPKEPLPQQETSRILTENEELKIEKKDSPKTPKKSPDEKKININELLQFIKQPRNIKDDKFENLLRGYKDTHQDNITHIKKGRKRRRGSKR